MFFYCSQLSDENFGSELMYMSMPFHRDMTAASASDVTALQYYDLLLLLIDDDADTDGGHRGANDARLNE